MKTTCILILMLLISNNILKAQQQGTIIYKQITNLHKGLGSDQQMLKAILPETTSQEFHFVYNNDYGMFMDVPLKLPDGMAIKLPASKNKKWFDFSKHVYRKYIEVDNELFHSESLIKKFDAKPTGKTRTILGHKCDEYSSTNNNLKVWVTPSLPHFITPMPPYFFEGAVLAVEIDLVSIEAISISDQIDGDLLTPQKSREITQEQYNDLQEELFNELKANGGNIISR